MAGLTHAMVMAAGEGTRLRPLTLSVAKPALPVANEPCMGHTLRNLSAQGVRHVIANCSYLAGQMQAVFADGSSWGVNLAWSVEEAPHGTAGGVKLAADFLREAGGAFAVLSGDGLHDVDLGTLWRSHAESGALATIALVEVVDPSAYGVVVLDDDGRVREFQEKPAPGTELSRLSNTGIYIFEPEVLDLLPAAGTHHDFGSEAFPAWLADGIHLNGVEVREYWNDIGNPDAYLQANLDCLTGTHGRMAEDSAYGDQVLVAASARVGADVEFYGPCVVGPGAQIGSGARLSEAVVLPGGTIEPGAMLSRGVYGNADALAAWADSFGRN